MSIIRHRFVTGVADGQYSQQVQPQRDWNDDHTFAGGTSVNGSLLVRSTSGASSSEGAAWLVPSSVSQTILMGQGSSATPAYSATIWPNAVTIGDLLVASSSVSNKIISLPDIAIGSALYSQGVGVPPKYVQPAATQTNSSNPPGTTNTGGVQMGLGGTITPTVTGRVLMLISGDVINNTILDGAKVQIRYGSSSPGPVNGSALAGTAAGGQVQYLAATSSGRAPFCLNALVTGLTLSAATWIDASLAAVTGGTATIENLSVTATEL